MIWRGKAEFLSRGLGSKERIVLACLQRRADRTPPEKLDCNLPYATTKDISEETGIPQKNLNRVLLSLIRKGLVKTYPHDPKRKRGLRFGVATLPNLSY